MKRFNLKTNLYNRYNQSLCFHWKCDSILDFKFMPKPNQIIHLSKKPGNFVDYYSQAIMMSIWLSHLGFSCWHKFYLILQTHCSNSPDYHGVWPTFIWCDSSHSTSKTEQNHKWNKTSLEMSIWLTFEMRIHADLNNWITNA